MGAEHFLARLTAQGVQITGEGFGGNAALTTSDIAGALAGLHGPVYWYMRLKFCADVSTAAQLRDAVAFMMLGDAMAGGVDVSARVAANLAAIAILEAVGGMCCSACGGTGVKLLRDTVKDCKGCSGTGKAPMTQGKAAELAGVSKPTYLKKHADTVRRYAARLETWESQGLSHVRRRIYGAD